MRKNIRLILLLFLLTVFACNLPGSPAGEPEPSATPSNTPVLDNPYFADTPTPEPTEMAETSPDPTETPPPVEPADTIFHNGTVLTMEDGLVTSAIAIKDGRVMMLGDDAGILALAGPETIVVNLDGRTLMPGFVDSHSHLFDIAEGDYAAAQELALANGITTVAEFFATDAVMADLTAMDQAGELHMRLSLYPVHVDNCGAVLGPWYFDAFPAAREPGARLHIPGVKLFSDGGSCNAPAVSYEFPVGGNGDLYFSAEDLAAMVVEVQEAGYQAAIHALGDRAIDTTLDALSIALDGGPNTYRHRIEHNAVLRPDQFARYSEVDPVATIFGAFPACLWAGDVSNFKYITPEGNRDWEWAWRPLIDANPGLHVAWHSDYPVFATMDPFTHLYGMVTRKTVTDDGGICEPPDWAADDVLGVEEALRMMTIEAAYALIREDEVGSLAVGKLADLVIVSENPLAISPDQLHAVWVQMTMVGGETVFCGEPEAAICP